MTDTAIEQQREQLRAELAEHTMYELLGGPDGIRAIIDRFYGLMDGDERFAAVRAMHAPDLGPMSDTLFEFLSGWLGGPPLYAQRPEARCMSSAHAPYAIDADARDAWLTCMTEAMQAAGVPGRYRDALMPALAGMAEMMRNV